MTGMQGLEGSRVVVTGGSSGIGEATARRFLAEGAHVAVIALPDDALRDVRKRLPGLAGAIPADVADRAQVEAGFGEVDRVLGGVDVLVANAGVSIRLASSISAPKTGARSWPSTSTAPSTALRKQPAG